MWAVDTNSAVRCFSGCVPLVTPEILKLRQRERERERQRQRHEERETDRERYRKRDTQTGRKQTEK